MFRSYDRFAAPARTTKDSKRPQFGLTLGDHNNNYFVILESQTPFTLSLSPIRSAALEGDRAFTPINKYRLEVRQNGKAAWWHYGRKEDIISPPGQFAPKEGCRHASRPPIKRTPAAVVEYEIE